MIGQTISHYKITEKLGEGGMGVVYKAEDTNLKRPVALKFLAAHLLGDEGVKERFRREAEAAAALTHSNIAVIHDINESDGHSFIAMEFVEGPTVGEKVGERPLKLEEALDITIQAVQGLQAAHEKDIVHRDIKSANLMVTPQGQVKIMDFGLAQLAERSKLTETTTILGTPSYMSPEQAVGDKTDRRTDLWSLGVVLYEMVTARLPFEAERQEAVLYGITNEEPEPVTALRAGLPMELEWIIGKALAKDRDERYQHAEDLLVDLRGLQKKLASGSSTILKTRDASQTGGAPSRSVEQIERQYRRKQTVLLGATALAVLLALVFAFFLLFSPTPVTEAPLRRFAFTTAAGVRAYTLGISPDGRHIAFVAADTGGSKLWVQDLNREQPRAIEGTEGAGGVPFWSPDSDFIGFTAGGELRKVSVQGGPVTSLCTIEGGFYGATWSPDGDVIVFSSGSQAVLYEVAAGGGTPEVLMAPDDMQSASADTPVVSSFANPQFLPSEAGDRVLLFVSGPVSRRTMIVQDLETGQREFLGSGVFPVYSPTGHLVYRGSVQGSDLWALPFSLSALQATGEPFLVARDRRSPSVANDGSLAYLDHIPQLRKLVFLDRDGNRTEEVGDTQRGLLSLSLSPDGRRVASSVNENSNQDIWVYDIARATRNRLTIAPEIEFRPVWSPDSEEIAFTSDRTGNYDIFVRRADGSEQARQLVGTEDREIVNDWSRDGKFLLYRRMYPGTRADLWYLQRKEDGSGWESHPFLESSFYKTDATFSPDGRYVAYRSDESGQMQVYVRPFPTGKGRSQVSSRGGGRPMWSLDGKELFYIEGNKWMSVSVSTRPAFAMGSVTRLFDRTVGSRGGYSVSADGKRFLVSEPVGETPQPSIRVVENWYEEFRDREQD